MARVQLEPVHRERLLARVSSSLDWPLLQQLIHRHRLAPLAYAHLNAVAAHRVPRATLVDLWHRHEHYARRNAQLRERMRHVVCALSAGGVRCIAYKGPVLADMLYGAVGLRAFDDLDLLVRRRDLDRASSILAKHGYTPYYEIDRGAAKAMLDARLQYHVIFEGNSPDHLLELHWKSDPTAPVEQDEGPCWDRGAFNGEETLLLSCIHAMRHHGYRLCWLVDVAELLRRHVIDWKTVFARAESIRARRRLHVALLMARRVLDAPVPAEIEQAMAGDAAAASIASQLESRLFVSDNGPPTAIERTKIDLAMRDRFTDRVRFVQALVCEPGFHEVTATQLPRGLFALYVPLRLMRLARKYVSTRSWRNDRTGLDAPADGAAARE